MTMSAFAPIILFLFANHKRTRTVVFVSCIFSLVSVAVAVTTSDHKANLKILKYIPMFVLILSNMFWVGGRNMHQVLERNLVTNQLNKKFK